ncbi:MAG: 1-(5-phosphoribosyl)-5-[(5-phosphoribosylamino)methylideneamino]imidazole-4-carboxamide isomerase [Bacteroidetes bacterium]|nr:1-(5-phosphoribosyl)-5-[(5-phosphoribosylamino)methylideneamino]imidazole-4-carboxamide isomerase [Bacteroidota bacterium]
MKIIPAIDIIGGKCVRLEQGDYSKKKIYSENPLEIAKQFEDNGIRNLHLVDLDGAKSGKIVNWKVLNQIASKTNLKIDFGGGIKSYNDLIIAFENGANQITAGSIAVKDKQQVLSWINKYGNEKIILGADVKSENIAINGWKVNTNLNVFNYISDYHKNGIMNVICTDISKDGMLKGTSVDLYKKILKKIPDIKLIASGGVTNISELDLLIDINVDGVIIGKAIYENKIKLQELKKYVD